MVTVRVSMNFEVSLALGSTFVALVQDLIPVTLGQDSMSTLLIIKDYRS